MDYEGFRQRLLDAQGGDRQAMDHVLGILEPHLRRFAHPYADPERPEESTSDLVQESCLRAWQKLGKFDGGKDDEETFVMFRAWMGQIVRRLGVNAERDRRRQKRSPPKKILRLDGNRPGASTTASVKRIDPPAQDPSPSTAYRSKESYEKIRAALKQIPDETDAKIVKLHLLKGETIADIARELDIEYEHVRYRYRLAVESLEQDLQGLL